MAAEFIGPVLDWMVATLENGTPALLQAAELAEFAEVRRSWTGVVMNWPAASVMPRASDFDPEGTSVHTVHAFTVKFGVAGVDADQVTMDAIAYMKVVDRALQSAVWIEQMSHVHITRHDYGPLWSKEAGFARFPEMVVEVETYEA